MHVDIILPYYTSEELKIWTIVENGILKWFSVLICCSSDLRKKWLTSKAK